MGTNWKLSDRTNPLLYTCKNPKSIEGNVGDDIISVYGRGRIVSMNDGIYHVELTSWRLDGRNKVHCYLKEVSVVRSKQLYEMTAYERILYAFEEKKKASSQFNSHNYSVASLSYSKVVNALQYMQNNEDNNL